MNKRIIGFIVAAVILVAGFMYFTKPAETQGTPSNHTVGNSSTGVTLVEYGDFQCPACASYYPILAEIKEVYKDKITFQFRHFPLESIHVNARASSRAAEAAGLQGKFFEMHDMLYQNQDSWSQTGDPLSTFETYAGAIGLDVAKFTLDYKSTVVNATINADLGEGKKLNVTATPTFFLDGVKLDNPGASYQAFAALIDEAIAKKTGQTTAPASQEATQPAEETVPTE